MLWQAGGEQTCTIIDKRMSMRTDPNTAAAAWTRDGTLSAAFHKSLIIQQKTGYAAEQFSTRAVCAIANVTAPTLYHHFGNADALLSAAIAEAFAQFLESKKAATLSPDPETALRQGWDDYVRFAAARPRLYATMMSRVLKGGHIPAAERGFAQLMDRIAAIAAEGRLAVAAETAADLAWASANAASLLHVTARLRKAAKPDPAVINCLRDQALQVILTPRSKSKPR